MNETWNWDDLRLFLAVARAGGLARAGTVTGFSAPTLARRMLSLERALGTELFLRRRRGYDLTSAGEELIGLAEAVERAALGIERWCSAADKAPRVRIAAGAWMSRFLARHMASLLEPEERLGIEIVTGIAPADLLRREANLGLRNRRPETPGLAGRRLVRVAFAIYGERGFLSDHPEARDNRRFAACPWIAFSPPGPSLPSSLWLDQQLLSEPLLTCSTAEAVLEAALAGIGLTVLPCFIGDGEPGLLRASSTLADLEHEQWLVSHDDDRHQREIKALAERLTALVRAHSSLFGGEAAV